MSKILVITDRRTHSPAESLYQIIDHLRQAPEVTAVYVADRADSMNASFFYALHEECQALSVFEPDADYSFNGKVYPCQSIPLSTFDAVWLRMDHPLSRDFLRYIARKFRGKFIVNRPKALVHTSTKLFLKSLEDVLGDLMPPVIVSQSAANIEKFAQQHPHGVVLKSWWTFHGNGVMRWCPSGSTDFETKEDVQLFLNQTGPCLIMPFLTPPDGQQSDNRLLVMNGKILGTYQRVPGKTWQCNLSAGGKAQFVDPTEREIEIIRRLDPIMRWHGISIYGIDCLVNDKGERVLSEINSANVGGFLKCQEFTGKPYCELVAKTLVRMINANSYALEPEALAPGMLVDT